MQKAPSLFLRWTFPALTTLNTHSDAAEEATPSETAQRSAEAVITKQCQEEWDSGTDSCCRLQLVEKDGHAVTLWPQISPPPPRKTENKNRHLSSLISFIHCLLVWRSNLFPSFLFYVRLCASPAKPFSTQCQSVKPRGGAVGAGRDTHSAAFHHPDRPTTWCCVRKGKETGLPAHCVQCTHCVSEIRI